MMLLGKDGEVKNLKWRAGKFYVDVRLSFVNGRIFLNFPYNKILLEEVKMMEGRKWHGFDKPPKKQWSVANSERNSFAIRYLSKEYNNPYLDYPKKFDIWTDLDEVPNIKKKLEENNLQLRQHQFEGISFLLTRPAGIWGYEMGLGKSIMWIISVELMIKRGLVPAAGPHWYAGPVAGVKAVSRELIKWNASFHARMYTYESLSKVLKEWEGGVPPYTFCMDESSKIKTPTAQRSQACKYIADAMRKEHEFFRIVEMTGTPSPKSPIDWWHQCEVAQPGFLAESHPQAFRKRLCLVEERENAITGGVYPHIVTWLDNENKCKKCGKLKDDPFHSILNISEPRYHTFEPSKNEVAYLHDRMKGLVLVKFKRDCTDLPEKQYEIINVTPTVDMLRTVKLIKSKGQRAITTLIQLRELADGFIYNDVVKGYTGCINCGGTGKIMAPVVEGDVSPLTPINPTASSKEERICDNCGGVGKVPLYERTTDNFGSPKDDVFIADLDENESNGRYVVWGGFTGTIDRLTDMARQKGWHVLRVDGRGYVGICPEGNPYDTDKLLSAMDRSNPNYRKDLDKVCFVGHPQAGGMGLTLTASNVELFYSNSFSGEARMQAEDRCHRLGMDENKGLIIKDIFLLPTDKLVYDNLMQKKELQDISMGRLEAALENI